MIRYATYGRTNQRFYVVDVFVWRSFGSGDGGAVPVDESNRPPPLFFPRLTRQDFKGEPYVTATFP